MPLLPRKPSKLIRLALRDLEAVEASPYYKVNMQWWHLPNRGNCVVCFAGAVMSQTLNTNAQEHKKPSSFSKSNEKRLEALNAFRTGELESALYLLGYAFSAPIPAKLSTHMWVIDYARDPVAFKAQMNQLADEYAAIKM